LLRITKYSKQWQTSAIYPIPISLRLLESLLTKHRFIKYVSIGNCSNIKTLDLCKSTEAKSGIFEKHSHAKKLGIYGKTYTEM
jgi:hypothetical protein